MTIPEEPVVSDPSEPDRVDVPEPAAPIEVPEPSIEETPERA
jgi:hypothetical protein